MENNNLNPLKIYEFDLDVLDHFTEILKEVRYKKEDISHVYGNGYVLILNNLTKNEQIELPLSECCAERCFDTMKLYIRNNNGKNTNSIY